MVLQKILLLSIQVIEEGVFKFEDGDEYGFKIFLATSTVPGTVLVAIPQQMLSHRFSVPQPHERW